MLPIHQVLPKLQAMLEAHAAGVLVAPPDLRAAGDRRLLGDADHFEDEDAIEDLAALHGSS